MSQNYLVNRKLENRQGYLNLDYFIDEFGLQPEQAEALQNSVDKKFLLGEFESLGDILEKLKVKVHIVPGTPERVVPGLLNEIKNHWENVAKRIEEENNPLVDEAEKEYGEARRKVRMAEEEKKNYQSMRMLGCYCRQDNTIKLFPENMDQNRMEEQLVSTLAHEVMHAYFNRPGHESFPYAYFVEEPLAEFGMLCYLKETKSPYYEEAYKDVKNKKTCYRYGANLMDHYLNGDQRLRGYLEKYKIKKEQWEIPEFPVEGGVVSLPHRCKIFVDMDGVLVDFQGAVDSLDEATKREYADDGKGKSHYDDVQGIFARMKPLPGAIDAMRRLKAAGYDLYILSTAPWRNASAWSDKVEWVRTYLNDVFEKRLIITHCKGLLAAQEGAYLIDDRDGHGATDFGERHIQIGADPRFPDWASVLDYFKS